MTRTHRFILAAIALAVLAIAAFVASRGLAPPTQHPAPTAQAQAPTAQARATRVATPQAGMGLWGPTALVNEIEQRRTEAMDAEAARAAADGDQTPSVAYLRAARAIWEDDRLRETPWIIQAGKDILDIHAYRHDQPRRVDTCVEILAVIDANRERWLVMAEAGWGRERMAESIDGQTRTILSGMQGAYNLDRPQITMAALERIIALETDEKKRENFIMQRDDLRYRMSIGLFGPEDPPEEWRIPPLDERFR